MLFRSSAWEKRRQNFEEIVSIESKPNRCVAAISFLIAKQNKSYSDVKFIKDCVQEVLQIYSPKSLEEFKKVKISPATVTRTVARMAKDSCKQLKEKLSSAEYYSLCIDETTNITQKSQVAIFIRYVNKDFETFETLANISTIKTNCNGQAVYECINSTMKLYNLS